MRKLNFVHAHKIFQTLFSVPIHPHFPSVKVVLSNNLMSKAHFDFTSIAVPSSVPSGYHRQCFVISAFLTYSWLWRISLTKVEGCDPPLSWLGINIGFSALCFISPGVFCMEIIRNNHRSLVQIRTHGTKLPSKEYEQDFVSTQLRCREQV